MTNNQAIEALLRIRCIIREDSLEEQALVYAIEALEGKDTDVPSNDTISRQVAIDVAREELESGTYFDIPSKIEDLPSAPKRKTGKWIDNTYCSECGWVHETDSGFIGSVDGFNFCPNCGSDNRG